MTHRKSEKYPTAPMIPSRLLVCPANLRTQGFRGAAEHWSLASPTHGEARSLCGGVPHAAGTMGSPTRQGVASRQRQADGVPIRAPQPQLRSARAPIATAQGSRVWA
ncbi:hypothetical protein BO70DRAFT_400708 [Aspergillus heteromorphus CBS 117.55]|uniref:Uncharacterized protein n=1 Tax=Aspergillus heteromorphus CBS 117.55 TaxID=1448321 RepID=A0A317UY97_9EURO|nr:uncharacterized protein BO70DRAFT_400708 [Aspergillus heteromorphus CBS 117.55]PWY66725.1 hypothetical protein BO70DRAFT_400708 [Aspergillus heteromorphus CBS 117.55]